MKNGEMPEDIEEIISSLSRYIEDDDKAISSTKIKLKIIFRTNEIDVDSMKYYFEQFITDPLFKNIDQSANHKHVAIKTLTFLINTGVIRGKNKTPEQLYDEISQQDPSKKQKARDELDRSIAGGLSRMRRQAIGRRIRIIFDPFTVFETRTGGKTAKFFDILTAPVASATEGTYTSLAGTIFRKSYFDDHFDGDPPSLSNKWHTQFSMIHPARLFNLFTHLHFATQLLHLAVIRATSKLSENYPRLAAILQAIAVFPILIVRLVTQPLSHITKNLKSKTSEQIARLYKSYDTRSQSLMHKFRAGLKSNIIDQTNELFKQPAINAGQVQKNIEDQITALINEHDELIKLLQEDVDQFVRRLTTERRDRIYRNRTPSAGDLHKLTTSKVGADELTEMLTRKKNIDYWVNIIQEVFEQEIENVNKQSEFSSKLCEVMALKEQYDERKDSMSIRAQAAIEKTIESHLKGLEDYPVARGAIIIPQRDNLFVKSVNAAWGWVVGKASKRFGLKAENEMDHGIFMKTYRDVPKNLKTTRGRADARANVSPKPITAAVENINSYSSEEQQEFAKLVSKLGLLNKQLQQAERKQLFERRKSLTADELADLEKKEKSIDLDLPGLGSRRDG